MAFWTPDYLEVTEGHPPMPKRAQGITNIDMSDVQDQLLCEGGNMCPYAATHNGKHYKNFSSNNPKDPTYWKWIWNQKVVSIWSEKCIKLAAKAMGLDAGDLEIHVMETPSGTGSAVAGMRNGVKTLSVDILPYCKVPGGYTFPEYQQDLREWDGIKATRLLEGQTGKRPNVILHPEAIDCKTWRQSLNQRNGPNAEETEKARQRGKNRVPHAGGEGRQAKRDNKFKSNMFKQMTKINKAAWRVNLYED